MRLVLRHPLNSNEETASIELQLPGCIVGSSCDADLPLSAIPGTSEIGRIQAVLRMQDGLLTIENISLKSAVLVNGRPLGLHQAVTLQLDDQLTIGDHVLTLQASKPAIVDNPATTPHPNQEADEPDTQAAQDIFGALLGGPGVIPVGSPIPPLPDDAQAHIFTDTRPTVLNQEDPLAQQAARDDISAVLDDERATPLNGSR